MADMIDKEFQIIESVRLANHLLRCGFTIYEVAFSKRKTGSVVFFFHNSKALQDELTNFFEKD